MKAENKNHKKIIKAKIKYNYNNESNHSIEININYEQMY